MGAAGCALEVAVDDESGDPDCLLKFGSPGSSFGGDLRTSDSESWGTLLMEVFVVVVVVVLFPAVDGGAEPSVFGAEVDVGVRG